MTQLTLILTTIYAIVSVICIVYTVKDVTMWLTGKHNRSHELIDLFDKRIAKHRTLTKRNVTSALRQSINDFVKSN